MQLPRLLLVEDHKHLAVALRHHLARFYEVDVASAGMDAIALAYGKEYAAIILDLGLPDITGLQACKRLRQDGCTAPILVLSGEGSVRSKLLLFEAGANDYVLKPFNLDELKARLRVLLRSTAPTRIAKAVVVAGLTIDPVNRSVERNGQPIFLRQKEYAILECLINNAGYVVSRSTIMSHAWSGNDDAWSDTVNVHIKYLRDKIDRPFDKPLIKTVRGLGYKLDIADTEPKVVNKAR